MDCATDSSESELERERDLHGVSSSLAKLFQMAWRCSTISDLRLQLGAIGRGCREGASQCLTLASDSSILLVSPPGRGAFHNIHDPAPWPRAAAMPTGVERAAARSERSGAVLWMLRSCRSRPANLQGLDVLCFGLPDEVPVATPHRSKCCIRHLAVRNGEASST